MKSGLRPPLGWTHGHGLYYCCWAAVLCQGAISVGGLAQRVEYLDVCVRYPLNCFLVVILVPCRLWTVKCTGYVILGTKNHHRRGFQAVNSECPGTARSIRVLASWRVLGPRLPASLKVLLVPVTSIGKECSYSPVPEFF